MNRLKELRNEYNLSIRALEKLLEIPGATIHSYELETRDFNTNMLRVFSDFFCVSIDYLLCHSNDGIYVYYEQGNNVYCLNNTNFKKYEDDRLIYYKDNKRFFDINKKLNIPKNKNISALFDAISQQDILEDFINDENINIKVPLNRIELVEKIIKLDENKLKAVKSMFELL